MQQGKTFSSKEIVGNYHEASAVGSYFNSKNSPNGKGIENVDPSPSYVNKLFSFVTSILMRSYFRLFH